jgi:hypothetical protein
MFAFATPQVTAPVMNVSAPGYGCLCDGAATAGKPRDRAIQLAAGNVRDGLHDPIGSTDILQHQVCHLRQ